MLLIKQEFPSDTRHGPQQDQAAYQSCRSLILRLHPKLPRPQPHMAHWHRECRSPQWCLSILASTLLEVPRTSCSSSPMGCGFSSCQQYTRRAHRCLHRCLYRSETSTQPKKGLRRRPLAPPLVNMCGDVPPREGPPAAPPTCFGRCPFLKAL